MADRRQHVGSQRLVALQFLADDLDAGLAGKAEIAVAHGGGIELAHLVIAVHAETFGEPCHGRGLHAGLTRLLAHRQQRDVARTVEHIARAGLQLLRHVVERLDDAFGQRATVHGSILGLARGFATIVSRM